MLDLQTAGTRIAEDLDAAERLANETLRAVARLQVSMMNARIDSDLTPYDGQIAVVRVQQASASLVEAQGNLAKAHKSMREDFIKMTGLTPPEDGDRCPTDRDPRSALLAA